MERIVPGQEMRDQSGRIEREGLGVRKERTAAPQKWIPGRQAPLEPLARRLQSERQVVSTVVPQQRLPLVDESVEDYSECKPVTERERGMPHACRSRVFRLARCGGSRSLHAACYHAGTVRAKDRSPIPPGARSEVRLPMRFRILPRPRRSGSRNAVAAKRNKDQGEQKTRA